ncbi:MAG: AMP-binding protein, partial [Prochlorothrix sp.]
MTFAPPDRSRSAQTFWIQQLTGAPFLLELPSDRSRPPQPSGQRRSEPFQWNGTLRQAVAAQAVQAHCGVEQVILGAFLAFLHRYSGQTDVVIGILPDQKTETLAKLSIEASNTAGNTDVLALRSRCGIARETAPSFAAFLQRTIATTTKINGFSNFPYAFLRQHFNIAPSRSYSPWFQVLFQFRSSPGTEPIVKPQAKPAYSQAERPQAELSQVELSQPEPSKSKNPHPENPKSGGDLVLSIDDRGQELRGILDYNPDLWDRETIANFLEHFQGFIGALVQNSQTPIAQIPLLSSQQRDWLQQWNPAPTPYSAGTVLELIAAQAQRSPQARAVVAPPELGEVSPMLETQLDSTLSYSEMMAQAAQISHFLAQRGIGEGQCVGLALGRSIYLVTAVLGVMGSGAAYVPLDPSYPADRLQFMAQDAGLSWVLTDRASFAQLHWLTDPQSEGARSEIPTSASPATEIPVSNGPDRSRSPDPPVPESQPESQPGLQSVLNSPKPSQKNLGLQNVSAIEDILNPSPHSTATSSPVFPPAQPALAPNSPRPPLAYIIYTSGSTGQPKGVAIGHSSLVNFLEAMQQQLHLTPEDTWLALTTLSFDIAALELLLPLMVGATVAIAPQASQRDGFLLAQTITQTQATVIQATPTTWQLLRLAQWTGEEQQPQAQPQPNRQGRENPDVSAPSTPKRQLLCGGEALTPPIARFLLQAAGPQGQVWNLYGPTETTIWSLIQPVTPELVHRYDRSASLPIGLPLANTQVYVLDAAQQLCGVGQPGEIYLGGAGLAQGYWQRPQLSADRFPWLSLAPIDASNQAEPLVLETQRQ